MSDTINTMKYDQQMRNGKHWWNFSPTDERGKTEMRKQLNQEYRQMCKQLIRNGEYEMPLHRRNVEWLWS